MKVNFFISCINGYVCDTMGEALNNQVKDNLSGKVCKSHINTGCDETNFGVPQWCLCIVQSL